MQITQNTFAGSAKIERDHNSLIQSHQHTVLLVKRDSKHYAQ